MATMAAGRRSRPAVLAPFRLLVRAARNITFVIAGIPAGLVAIGAMLVPLTVRITPRPIVIEDVKQFEIAAALPTAVILVFLLRVPLTAMQRHRHWSLLGDDIPRSPATSGPLLRRWLAILRSEATWRQLLYHLVIAPALAAGGLLTLGLLAGGAGLAAIYEWSALWPPFSDVGGASPKVKVVATCVGVIMLLAAPIAAALVTWLDRKAARALLGPSRSVELEHRVETLSQSRAGVVDAADAERRRIERDLHDGAQQRLVSLAMNLGMAREGLTDLPDEARQVLAAAHDEAKEALAELRNLVRGLHPAVLDDRGLDAALSGIAARAPLPVRLTVDMPERASPTVEAVAYFVVSECLTNIARHACARHASIEVRRIGSLLRLQVTDDGIGGADPARGTGLASLEHRARSVDGSLRVDSPAGGPTVVTVELPCES